MKTTFTASAVLVSIALAAASVEAQAPAAGASDKAHAIVATPNVIQWGPAPDVLPPGAQAAVLEGDPAQPGPFTLRLRLPADYRLPPHYHPVTEHVIVLEGTFYVGMGDVFDASKGDKPPHRHVRGPRARRAPLRPDESGNRHPASRCGAMGLDLRQRRG
jgi:hypothetical protein